MVLQEIISPTSKEFILKTNARDLKSLLESRVKQLFGVDFQILPCQTSDETVESELANLEKYESLQWIRVVCEEDPELLDRAKEYIISVCNPEVRYRVDFPVCDLYEERAPSNISIVDEIERKTAAYLALDSEGFLEICGSKMAVALASSCLDQMRSLNLHNDSSVQKDVNENHVQDPRKSEKEDDLETEVVWKRRETTKPKVVKPSKATESPKESTSAGRSDELKDSKLNEKSITIEGKKDPCIKETAITSIREESGRSSTEGALGSPDAIMNLMESQTRNHEEQLEQPNMILGESLRDFARKLRYSESEVSSALSKLGPEADNNQLLMELVKAQNSAKQIEEGSSLERPIASSPVVNTDPSTFRPIVIDGSNVAMSHGNQKVFSCRGIGIAVDYFIERGHRNIKVFVPSWRKESSKPESPIIDQDVLSRLEEDNILVWTPSRCINGRRVICYDDRFIIRLAHQTDGVIVSNDNFRDLQNESSEWKKVIEQRLLMYSFVDDRFMPPDDPAGRYGPNLNEFLLKGCGKPCPYGRRCTYGNRCKYLHPERNSKTEAEMVNVLANQLSETMHLQPPDIPYGETKSRPGSFHEPCTQRQARPLPPLPDMPAYLLTKPLPPTPTEIPRQRQAKPLPIPQFDMYNDMARLFPPTLRNNQSNPIQRPFSDPLPQSQPYHDVSGMPEQYSRPVARRGSLPPVMSESYEGYPSLPPGNGHYNPYPSHQNMRPPPDIPHRMVVPEDMYGACAGYQPPYQQVLSHPWAMPQFQQQHGPFPSYYGTNACFQPHYPSNFNGGQGSAYYRTRSCPTDTEVTDGPRERSEASLEEDRVRVYEKLLEVFPDDAAKILKIMDENPIESNVESLTQLLLKEGEDEEKK